MCYDYYAAPVLPKILIVFEDEKWARGLAGSVKENVTVVAPGFNTDCLLEGIFEVVYLFGEYNSTEKLRRFFTNAVHPSAKKDATWHWI